MRAPDLVDSALAYSLSGPLRPQERGVISRGLFARPELQQLLYDYMTRNYDTILFLTSPQAAYFMPFYASGCSSQRLEAAKAFFAEPAHNRPGLDKEVAKVADQVGDCVDLRQREGPAVESYLKQLSAAK
jgi:alanyl aminopeptidase